MQYGGAPGGPTFPGQTQDPLYGYFAAVAGQDGQIDADELQRCLTQSGIAGGYKLQRDMSGTMGFNEFKELWAVLNGWRQHFISFDSDRSGTVDPQELQKALTAMGFRLSPQAVNSIAKRYSTNGKITFDDYIACCVKLRALTDSFRRRDTAQQGVVNFPYDDQDTLLWGSQAPGVRPAVGKTAESVKCRLPPRQWKTDMVIQHQLSIHQCYHYMSMPPQALVQRCVYPYYEMLAYSFKIMPASHLAMVQMTSSVFQ
ncbi:sorcin [Camelus ferus]|nr:sorcin [Camelus ferus]